METSDRDDLDLLVHAATHAAAIARGYFGQSPETWYKGHERSPVSEADMAVDQYLKEILIAARPGYGWLSEESHDDRARVEKSRVFVVDPIDGTRGFLAGKPDWCVSIAVVEHGTPVAGVLAAPVSGAIWSASAGDGAFLDGARLQAAPQDAATPLTVSMPDSLAQDTFAKAEGRLQRAPGGPSLALRLARVAKGELDGVLVRPHSSEWDVAAADLILRESGYRLVDRDGADIRYNRPDPSFGFLVAGRPDHLGLFGKLIP